MPYQITSKGRVLKKSFERADRLVSGHDQLKLNILNVLSSGRRVPAESFVNKVQAVQPFLEEKDILRAMRGLKKSGHVKAYPYKGKKR